jgi:hypothetical protein
MLFNDAVSYLVYILSAAIRVTYNKELEGMNVLWPAAAGLLFQGEIT